jgi:hypothetical protein
MALKQFVRLVLEALGLVPRTDLSVRFVGEHPERNKIDAGVLQVVGDKRFQKWAVFRCPCGCGETVMLSLSTKRRPSWRVTIDWLGRPTLHPSIRQTAGCHSHFWLKRGRLVWCADTGR